eukprot:4878179-Lingulodinium_polyedra.AAC.1
MSCRALRFRRIRAGARKVSWTSIPLQFSGSRAARWNVRMASVAMPQMPAFSASAMALPG